MPSFRCDISKLKAKAEALNPAEGQRAMEEIAREKGVAALIAQAIADNFEKEGPGWAPLSAKTIRQSVSKKLAKRLSGLTDKQLLRVERTARKKGAAPNRKILQKTGLLMRTATTPGYAGANKKASGSNIYQVQNTTIVWGTSLSYAAVHEKGLHGVPKREFLKLQPDWVEQIRAYVDSRLRQRVLKLLKGAA